MQLPDQVQRTEGLSRLLDLLFLSGEVRVRGGDPYTAAYQERLPGLIQMALEFAESPNLMRDVWNIPADPTLPVRRQGVEERFAVPDLPAPPAFAVAETPVINVASPSLATPPVLDLTSGTIQDAPVALPPPVQEAVSIPAARPSIDLRDAPVLELWVDEEAVPEQAAPAAPEASIGLPVPPGVPRRRVRRPEPAAAPVTVSPRRWTPGFVPSLAAIAAVGLLLVASAYLASRLGLAWSSAAFWGGLAVMVIPIAYRISAEGVSTGERVALVALVGMALYGVKVFHSPIGFTFHDELLHLRTADQILQSDRLFSENSQLPASAVFPGLEIVTTALAEAGGISLFQAGVIVVGVARLLISLALFLFYREVTASPRIAGIAAILYMANANFVFFNAQFSYESLSLPIGIAVLYLIARRENRRRREIASLTVLIALGFLAIVVTHHLTAYVLAGFLGLWVLATIVAPRPGDAPGTVRRMLFGRLFDPADGRERSSAFWTSLLAASLSIAWLAGVAGVVVSYLAPVIVDAAGSMQRLLSGELGGRTLFQDFSGQRAPLWEQITGIVGTLLVVIGLAVGGIEAWRRGGLRPLLVALMVVVPIYPASLALRFVPQGWEISSRLSEFLFIGVALFIAFAVEWQLLRRPTFLRRAAFATGTATILFAGMIIGWPYYARLPGSYLVSADTRSIEPQGLAAADWASMTLGTNNRIAADRINALLWGAYGRQRVVTNVGDGVLIAPVFLSPSVGAEERERLAAGKVRYMVVDERISTALPVLGYYFEIGEPEIYRRTQAADLDALRKFNSIPSVSRVFDSGDIVVYDVGTIDRAP